MRSEEIIFINILQNPLKILVIKHFQAQKRRKILNFPKQNQSENS